MENKITKEKIEKYLKITEQAFKKIKVNKKSKAADEVLDMARRYYDDAKYYNEKGDLVTAFAAVNYAHGWLDAGARLKLFDVDKDSGLFTVD